MDKTVEIALLFDFYGGLLTEKQRECIELYYNDDLSLAEIAEMQGITRQGARDSIVRAEKALYDAEASAGLVKRFGGIAELVDEMCRHLTALDVQLEGSADYKFVRDGLMKLKGKVSDGI